MGTASSKFTGFDPKRQADPRVLSDAEMEAARRLLLTGGIWDAAIAEYVPAPSSTRHDRRVALSKLRKHVKIKRGYTKDFGRQTVAPKFPGRHSPNEPV